MSTPLPGDTPPVVRAALPEDLPAINEIYNHYVEHTSTTFDLVPWSATQRTEWFTHYGTSGRHRVLVITTSGLVVGYATSSQFRQRAAYDTSVETSIYLHPEFAGYGFGSTLYAGLFQLLASEPIHRFFAGVTLPNDASLALHHTFGFTKVGVMHEAGFKHERYWDVMWLEKSASDR